MTDLHKERNMNRAQTGFTLIEIAIVLVIIGLLLGGVLKGQELITAARVRGLIAQQEGIKAAFFGFQDRYRGLPGDYPAAADNIKCSPACLNGNGNGRIEDDSASSEEYISVWAHLTAAGFMNGSYSAISGSAVEEATTPKNPYGAHIKLSYDDVYGDPGNPVSPRHNLKTGPQVPVEILAEVDRKVDDGLPSAGGFQFALFGPDGGLPDEGLCLDLGEGTWDITGNQTNCGGTSLF
jgi:prepilin-type N-terminal cleavage/methylation domain-containing protein